jgi:sec-independent protein translocase protein TatB
MLSIPHMIVVFVIVLVVFGPQKLPELARGLGKLMAEFRKASTDFKSAFEEEMRDLERQAREVERKKQALLAEANAALQPATLASPSGLETQPAPAPLAEPAQEVRATEAGELTPTPVAEAVARGSAPEPELGAAEPPLESTTSSSFTSSDEPTNGAGGSSGAAAHPDPAHDRQQPA